MKKLLELLKKLLGGKSSSDGSSSGFTLIELLIVIAILGILAGGLLLAIDPAEKLRQGNDTRAINDVSQTASKIEQHAISANNGIYITPAAGNEVPTTIGAPTPPNSSYDYEYFYSGAATNTFVLSVVRLQSKKYTVAPNNNPVFVYVSSQGKSCFLAAGTVPSAATTCP